MTFWFWFINEFRYGFGFELSQWDKIRRICNEFHVTMTYPKSEKWYEAGGLVLENESSFDPEDDAYLYVTLSITGENLDPNEITNLLDITPAESHHKGSTFYSTRYKKEIVRDHGIWQYSTKGLADPYDIDAHLELLHNTFDDEFHLLQLFIKKGYNVTLRLWDIGDTTAGYGWSNIEWSKYTRLCNRFYFSLIPIQLDECEMEEDYIQLG